MFKINIINIWENNYYKNPSLTLIMIEHAEKELGIKLPTKYIELLKKQNGGYTKGFAYLTKKKTS